MKNLRVEVRAHTDLLGGGQGLSRDPFDPEGRFECWEMLSSFPVKEETGGDGWRLQRRLLRTGAHMTHAECRAKFSPRLGARVGRRSLRMV